MWASGSRPAGTGAIAYSGASESCSSRSPMIVPLKLDPKPRETFCPRFQAGWRWLMRTLAISPTLDLSPWHFCGMYVRYGAGNPNFGHKSVHHFLINSPP
jgi:hypothetical protein